MVVRGIISESRDNSSSFRTKLVNVKIFITKHKKYCGHDRCTNKGLLFFCVKGVRRTYLSDNCEERELNPHVGATVKSKKCWLKSPFMPGRAADVAEDGTVETSMNRVRGSLQGPFFGAG